MAGGRARRSRGGAGAVIAGAFAGLFVVALAVAFAVGRRGWRAVRSAYKFAFGWANWITP